jgi:hypothetical protein
MKTVWIYHLKVFATPELADAWFKENDPEGVAFGHEVIEEYRGRRFGTIAKSEQGVPWNECRFGFQR